MARLYGIQTPIDPEHLRSTLRAIYKYNFREDLSQHACTQRPGYANGHEAGLLLCTWPRGEKLTLPFPYSDEVWTGIEYQVASHMILEGMTDEALAIVSGVRRRYDGRTRNPFNEYECGNYYARAMASYALLTALSGFRYTAADRTLRFRPKYSASHFRCLFSTDGAYGTISLDNHRVTVNVIEGQLALNRLILSEGDVLREIPWSATIGPGEQQSVT